jgi:hypothetical protein
MTLSLWLLPIGAVLLLLSVVVLGKALRRRVEGGIYWDLECAMFKEDDFLALEIGERIFSKEDWEIVRNETTRHFARAFRDERSTLAIAWLGLVRSQVRRLIHDYRLLARVDRSVRVADELAMAAQFLLFELTTAAMRGLILIQGPSHVARVLAFSLDSARRLRRMVRDVVPDSASLDIGIVKTNS